MSAAPFNLTDAALRCPRRLTARGNIVARQRGNSADRHPTIHPTKPPRRLTTGGNDIARQRGLFQTRPTGALPVRSHPTAQKMLQ